MPAGGGHRDLPQADSSVARRDLPVEQDAESRRFEPPASPFDEQAILKAAAGECDGGFSRPARHALDPLGHAL